jgi:predicted nucleic acid-binding protein
MSFMNAVDTNVYVYALDADEAAEQARAVELFDQLMLKPGQTVLLWQVACEFLGQLRRWQSQGRLTAAEVAAAFERARAMFQVRMPTEALFQLSSDLRARFSLSHWDSMVLAACKEAGVTTFYSEDMGPGTDYDGVTVVSPFG